ncbi:MAG: hypothetical protein AMXMBFR13_15400 [Phycisphaerae bacterium]
MFPEHPSAFLTKATTQVRPLKVGQAICRRRMHDQRVEVQFPQLTLKHFRLKRRMDRVLGPGVVQLESERLTRGGTPSATTQRNARRRKPPQARPGIASMCEFFKQGKASSSVHPTAGRDAGRYITGEPDAPPSVSMLSSN